MSKKILIIEDEAALTNTISLALGNDYDIVSAATGGEGIRKAKEEKPDLILLDLMLPDKTGIEILKELKEYPETEGIKVIVITNLNDSGTISKILLAGGKDYLIKSDWSIGNIVKKIEQALK